MKTSRLTDRFSTKAARLARAAFVLAAAGFLAAPVRAAVFYMSPAGSDSAPGTETQPWRSFAAAFSRIASGDELVLLDGTYTSATTGLIHWNAGALSSNQIPSGLSSSQRTVVRAKTTGGARLEGDFFVGRSSRKDSYILFRGLKVSGNGQFYNTGHDIVKECFFGNGFGIGTNDHDQGNSYDLVEDCVIVARNERIVAGNYRADNNVWRRVVVRGDGCNTADCVGSGNPNVRFTVYNSKNCSVQNMIILDSVLNGGEPYADFATAQHDGSTVETPLQNNEWIGSLSLNSEDSGFQMEADNSVAPSHRLSNCVVISRAAASDNGGINIGGDKGSVVENCTVAFRAATTGSLIRRYDNTLNPATRNSIASGNAAYGVIRGGAASYLDVSGSFTGARLYDTTVSPGDISTDPRTNGSLKYPVRIETGSALKGAGAGGVDIGANVLYKTGADGSAVGDPGYNSPTASPLWPWPNEDQVKSFLCAERGETRGLCSAASLTRYVWEMLGNPIPADIYGGAPAPDAQAPTAPQNPAAQALSSSTVSVQWTAATDNVGVTDYKLDVSVDPAFGNFVAGYGDASLGNVTSASVAGLSAGATYYARLRARDAAGNVSPNSATASATTFAASSAPPVPATSTVTVVAVGDVWRYAKGTAAPDPAWNGAGFNDAAWLNGPTGIGYGDGDDATGLGDMLNNYLTVYARKSFTVDNPAAVAALTLTIDYDDGYVAYLNGVEVARGDMPAGTPAYDTPALSHEAGTPVTVDLSARKNLLVAGANVLAIEVHNTALSSSDLSLAPELTIASSGGTAADAQAPSAPAGLAMTAPAADAVQLAWSASTDNVGVTDYRLDVSVDPAFGSFLAGYNDLSLGNVTAKTVAGLAADTVYYARLRARDAAGNTSAHSATVSARTLAPPSAPPVISNIKAVNVTGTGATITWTTDIPATSQVEYGKTAGYGSLTARNNTPGTSHSVVLTGLNRRTTYHYRVSSVNTAGQTAVSPDKTLRTAQRAPGPGVETSPDIITPALADGYNDQAVFDADVLEVRIQDLNGRELFQETGDGSSPIVWTACDEQGRVVESGAYVATLTYADNETANRLIVVAK